MTQSFNKGNILQLRHDPPAAADIRSVKRAGTVIHPAVISERGQRHVSIDDGHTFGTVKRVRVITGSVPERKAGCDKIRFAFSCQGGIPARALQILIARFPHVHLSVNTIYGDPERAEQRHFSGKAAPPCVAVIVFGVGDNLPGANGKQSAGDSGLVVRTGTETGVFTDRAVHSEGVHPDAIELHRNRQPDDVHRIVAVVCIQQRVVLVIYGNSTFIVIVRTNPKKRGPHVFSEISGKRDPGTVGHECRVRYRKCRNVEGLKAHADFCVRLRDIPVDITIAHLDDLTVRSEGGIICSPILMAHFKKDDALERIGSHDIDLRAQPCGSLESIDRSIR